MTILAESMSGSILVLLLAEDSSAVSFMPDASASAADWTKMARRSNLDALANAILEAVTKCSPVSPFPNCPNSERPAE